MYVFAMNLVIFPKNSSYLQQKQYLSNVVFAIIAANILEMDVVG